MSLQYATLQPLDPNTRDKTFELNATNNLVRYDVRRWSVVSVEAQAQIGWSTAVLTVYRSNDGYNVFALESAVTLGPGSAQSATIDTSAFNYLIVKLTTVEGGAKYADITVTGKASTP